MNAKAAPRIGENIIDECYHTLMSVDSTSPEDFLDHTQAIYYKLVRASQSSQVLWAIDYWCTQLEARGLSSNTFRRECESRRVLTVASFKEQVCPVIAELASRHGLPDSRVKLPVLWEKVR